jgi:hypothetical protein
MVEETRIERFFVPTLGQLADLKSNTVGDDELKAVQRVLQAWWDGDKSHEDALQECDRILGTCGVVSLDIEDASHYTDEGIRMCPPFSYCNAGDTYATTLFRDHKASAWCVACWGDLAEEYERDEEIGDYEVFDACPEVCPSCHGKAFSLEHFPRSDRGPSYSWVCDSCNHHCFAASEDDSVTIGEDEDCHAVQVHAVKVGEAPVYKGGPVLGVYRFEVRLEGVDAPEPQFMPAHGRNFDTAEDARERFHAVMAHRAELDAEDD